MNDKEKHDLGEVEQMLKGTPPRNILISFDDKPPRTLEELAKHRATMIIFLSVGRIAELAERLRTAYPSATPVAVVYKASWPEEKIVTGTLLDIAEKVQAAGITKTALVTVGEFLGDTYALSKLYDKTFTHEFRKGTEA